MKIILIGYGILAENLLNGILNTSHKVVGCVNWDSRKMLSKISNSIWPDGLEKLRKRANIPCINTTSINSYDFIQKAIDLEPDIILIGSWGEILKKQTICIPKKYCINCHPSYLPKHRGSNPYASSIISNEKHSGISFHKVDEGIDTGPILLQKKVIITPYDTGGSLRIKCAYTAGKMIPTLLENIENNTLQSYPQDESLASYYPRLTGESGSIDWNKTALEIYNQIRGLQPWIESYTLYKNHLIIIKSAEIINYEHYNSKPGSIIIKNHNGILVSTTTPDKCLLIKKMNIYNFENKISEYLLSQKIQIGETFRNAI